MELLIPENERFECAALITLGFDLVPQRTAKLPLQYAVGLHAWFLDQVRQSDPALAQALHDAESEKPFTLSRLQGPTEAVGKQLRISPESTYRWYASALSPAVAQWMQDWSMRLPARIPLRQVLLQIRSVGTDNPPTSYRQLLPRTPKRSLALTFVTPTSFRRKGHHYPLPTPTNVFHSYLRRWNHFAGHPVDPEPFLSWIDENVAITRHQLESLKVAAGKRGSVTGFVGTIEFQLEARAQQQLQFARLFVALGSLAPYCSTGHKTAFGLGQTRLGWSAQRDSLHALLAQAQFAERVEELAARLLRRQKRPNGDRAQQVCHTRATILARQENGEALGDIATDLALPYDTVKSYAKVARQTLRAVAVDEPGIDLPLGGRPRKQ